MKEKLNKKQFESLYEKQPPQAVWERIEDQIEDKGSRGGISWRTLLSAAAVLLIGVSLWFWNQPEETAIAEATQKDEQVPVSTVEVPIASVEDQHQAQGRASTNEEAGVEQAESTQVSLVEESNPLLDNEDPVNLEKLPLASTTQLPVRQNEVVAKVQLERRSQIRTPLVKLPRAEMELQIEKAPGRPVELQVENQKNSLAMSEDKKPTLRFRGLTATESALYIVKDEIDHIAGDVVMAGKRKLKDFNIQF